MRNVCLIALLISFVLAPQLGWSQGDSDSDGLSLEGSGQAEASLGESDSADQQSAPVEASVLADSTSRSYPSASLSIKLDLFSLPIGGLQMSSASVLSMTYPVLLEISLDVAWRFSLYFATGTYLLYSGQTDETNDVDEKYNVGVLLLQGGVRFNLMEPRPERAHLFISADFAGAIGLASVDNSDEDDDVNEAATEAAMEAADHLIVGTAIGIEYLVVSEFGIGAEFGLRWMFNNLHDINTDLDPYVEGFFISSFGLRLSYHF